MVDERNFDGLLKEIWKSLGRVEAGQENFTEKLEEDRRNAKESIRERDAKFLDQSTKLDGLADRQRDDARRLVDVQQQMVVQVDGVQKEVINVGVKVDDQEKRLGAIETPIRKAVAARQARTASLAKIVTIASAVSAAVWLLVEPIWKVGVDLLLHKIVNGGPMP